MRKKPTKISGTVRQAILDCGESRYRISTEMGITQATLSRFVHGETSLSMPTLDRLAEYLELEIVMSKRRVKQQREKK